jgi:translation elongation factor P/translation initiation factor 5A
MNIDNYEAYGAIIYYEAHITLPPSTLTDEQAVKTGKDYGFHHSVIDGDGDVDTSILTTRDKDYSSLKDRMINLMDKINWARYKVEAIAVDSKIDEEWGLKK